MLEPVDPELPSEAFCSRDSAVLVAMGGLEAPSARPSMDHPSLMGTIAVVVVVVVVLMTTLTIAADTTEGATIAAPVSSRTGSRPPMAIIRIVGPLDIMEILVSGLRGVRDQLEQMKHLEDTKKW